MVGLLREQHVQPHEVPAHLQREHRERQRKTDPEPPGHVGELGVGAGLGGREFGLQRHAADRAGARSDLPHLEVHRTDEDRAFGYRLLGPRRVAQIALGVRHELRPAPGRAEVVGPPFVVGAMRRRVRVDAHPADRIDRKVLRRRGGAMPAGFAVPGAAGPCFANGAGGLTGLGHHSIPT
jgi:hypothetical protein